MLMRATSRMQRAGRPTFMAVYARLQSTNHVWEIASRRIRIPLLQAETNFPTFLNSWISTPAKVAKLSVVTGNRATEFGGIVLNACTMSDRCKNSMRGLACPMIKCFTAECTIHSVTATVNFTPSYYRCRHYTSHGFRTLKDPATPVRSFERGVRGS